MPSIKDLTGERFNQLLVIRRAENQGRRVMWVCRCDCGGEIVTRGHSIQTGHTVSCGCVGLKRLSDHRYTHGKYGSRAYGIWQGMKSRCYSPGNTSYRIYGGRGISVCQEWRESFEAFYRDMGDPPEGFSIDRKDPDKNYCLENCRWASSFDQARTKRSNIHVSWRGEDRVLEDWATHLNINIATLYARVVRYNWDIERAFTRPIKKGRDKQLEVTL